ncbi:toxin expression-transcriptional accessory protein [Listeria aquatica FSL S10-1188]|uniref:Toxin expression-transcriptional accessory protein n=1 Tax=Listeria aquatica FSL S10-1188 TaxID=1265818 RepID=W7AZN4_9LIST|nr:toxin expression-transcriptional accessory protein [Listeria aquatica FSL S10-1188]
MEQSIMPFIYKKLDYQKTQIDAVIKLLEDGNTVPFIARYRKENTGSLDEVAIRDIEETYDYVLKLETRKEEILRLIEEQGKLTDELREQIIKADQQQKLEDLYRPYKQKKRTKATIAKEHGLEPLAKFLWTFSDADVEQEAKGYLSEDVVDVNAALLGAHEIIAEEVSDQPEYREWIRNFTRKFGMIHTEKKEKMLWMKKPYMKCIMIIRK